MSHAQLSNLSLARVFRSLLGVKCIEFDEHDEGMIIGVRMGWLQRDLTPEAHTTYCTFPTALHAAYVEYRYSLYVKIEH